MCVSGEIMITTLLVRDYKKEKKAKGWGWEKICEVRDKEQKNWET